MLRMLAIVAGVAFLSVFTCTVRSSIPSDTANQRAKADVVRLNDRPDHLYWFIQVLHVWPLYFIISASYAHSRISFQSNWFSLRTTQISDIHISIFHDEQRIDNFEQFVTETVDTIKPPIVLASGDLTDARDNDHIGARQYVREWQIYNDIVTRSNVKNKTYWMDIKGNHGKLKEKISHISGVNGRNFFLKRRFLFLTI